MDPQVVKWLHILGFQESDMKCMKMTILNSQWRKMTLLKHPDKPGGKHEDFQELMNAYENLGRIVEQTPPEDPKDHDEVKARKTFNDVNFTTENISSVTINIDTKMVKHWETVLTEKLGDPIDRSKGEDGKNNGKQWVDGAYKVDEEESVSKVYITLWFKQKKEKSTMLIQAENSLHFLNVSYVTNVVPTLYEEAMDHFEKETPAVSTKKNVKNKLIKSPRNTRTTKKAGNTPSCKSCVFSAKNVTQLNDHMISVHKKKMITNKAKQPEVTPYKPPTLSAGQLVEISGLLTKPCQCGLCDKGFDNYTELSAHEKEHHESHCSFCTDVFSTKTDLRDHVIKLHVSPQRTVNKETTEENRSVLINNKDDGKPKETDDEDEVNGDNYVWETSSHTEKSKPTEIDEKESTEEETSTPEINPSTPERGEKEPSDQNNSVENTDKMSAPKKKTKLMTETTEIMVEEIDTESTDNEDSFVYYESNENTEALENEAFEVSTQTDKNSSEIEKVEGSSQTDVRTCEVCDINKNKIDSFETLEREHRELKALYEKTRDLYFDQADEKQVLNEKIQELEEKKSTQAKEIIKLKRENSKADKNLESKVQDLENKECYSQVNKYEQENVKLKEEKRLLEELRKMDENDPEEVEINEEDEDDEDPADIIDMMDDDPDDDEVIAFYLNQNLNRAKRTNPATEATKKPKDSPHQDFQCEACNFKTNRKDILDAHTKSKHEPKKIACDRCDFVSKTKEQNRKHSELRHKNNKDCWYWCNGVCRNAFCTFDHPVSKQHESQKTQGPGNQGNHPNGNFSHTRNTRVPCFYQDRCQNANCPFDHFLGQKQAWNQMY